MNTRTHKNWIQFGKKSWYKYLHFYLLPPRYLPALSIIHEAKYEEKQIFLAGLRGWRWSEILAFLHTTTTTRHQLEICIMELAAGRWRPGVGASDCPLVGNIHWTRDTVSIWKHFPPHHRQSKSLQTKAAKDIWAAPSTLFMTAPLQVVVVATPAHYLLVSGLAN